jgi:hypothetical protein
MFDFLFEIFAEFLLQAIIEVLFEFGLRSLAEPLRKAPNPWLAAFGYGVFGSIAGAISLHFFPAHLVTVKGWRIVNVVVTPIAVGLFMALIGRWRARRGQEVLRIDRFAYGYLFALLSFDYGSGNEAYPLHPGGMFLDRINRIFRIDRITPHVFENLSGKSCNLANPVNPVSNDTR